MILCPGCLKEISNWARVTCKVAKINGVYHHIACLGDRTIKDVTYEVASLPDRVSHMQKSGDHD